MDGVGRRGLGGIGMASATAEIAFMYASCDESSFERLCQAFRVRRLDGGERGAGHAATTRTTSSAVTVGMSLARSFSIAP